MAAFEKDALNAIKAIRDFFTRFFIDGGLPGAIAEEHARSSDHMDIGIVQKANSEMKQLKQMAVNQQQPTAEQDTRKGRT